MAFPRDWTTYKAHPDMYVGLDPGTAIVPFDAAPQLPILGAGSLRLHRNGSPGRYAHVVRAASTGFPSGIMRCLVRAKIQTSGEFLGILFQQSQADLTAASGEAYGAGVLTSGGTSTAPRLLKLTAGLTTSTTLHSTVGLPSYDIRTLALAIEARWVPGASGLQVTVRYGRALDYSDLATVLSVLITSSVLSASVGQGLGVSLSTTEQSTGGGILGGNYLFDQVSCEPLLVA